MVAVHFYAPHGVIGAVARLLGALSPFHPWRTRYSHIAVEAAGYVFSMSLSGLEIYDTPDIPNAGERHTVEVAWADGDDVFLTLMDAYDESPRFRWHGLLELWFDVPPKRRPTKRFICTDLAALALDLQYSLTPDQLATILDL